MIGKILAAAVLATVGIAASAQAADYVPYRQPYTVAQPLNAYSWAGPYLGANLGYNWGSVSFLSAKPSGVSGGVQAGYNWQSGALVFGLEGDLQANSADDRFATWKFSNPWFGTIRGRVGYAFDNVLLYGTGGLAFGTLRAVDFARTESHTSPGWTVGVGAEFGLTRNWSAKVEYLYVSLSDSRFGITGTPNGYESSLVRVGVNYRFNWGAPYGGGY